MASAFWVEELKRVALSVFSQVRGCTSLNSFTLSSLDVLREPLATSGRNGNLYLWLFLHTLDIHAVFHNFFFIIFRWLSTVHARISAWTLWLTSSAKRFCRRILWEADSAGNIYLENVAFVMARQSDRLRCCSSRRFSVVSCQLLCALHCWIHCNLSHQSLLFIDDWLLRGCHC